MSRLMDRLSSGLIFHVQPFYCHFSFGCIYLGLLVSWWVDLVPALFLILCRFIAIFSFGWIYLGLLVSWWVDWVPASFIIICRWLLFFSFDWIYLGKLLNICWSIVRRGLWTGWPCGSAWIIESWRPSGASPFPLISHVMPLACHSPRNTGTSGKLYSVTPISYCLGTVIKALIRGRQSESRYMPP